MGEVLDFLTDVERKRYFVDESKEHPAKLEIRTFRWLVERYTQPGDVILDPMSGIGTVHLAATMRRPTIAIELSPRFVEIQKLNIAKLDKTLGLTAKTEIRQGDCRRILPLPPNTVSAIIFSPPYADVEKAGIKTGFTDKGELMNVGAFGYDEQQSNVGNLTVYPTYLDAMRHVYIACNRTLAIGSYLISVTKDRVKGGERVFIAKDNVRMCMEAGFELDEWHIRKSPFTIRQVVPQRRRQEKGTDKPELNIRHEDLLVFTKVKEV
jgi:modification methylase